jgi:hypothetical protein
MFSDKDWIKGKHGGRWAYSDKHPDKAFFEWDGPPKFGFCKSGKELAIFMSLEAAIPLLAALEEFVADARKREISQ